MCWRIFLFCGRDFCACCLGILLGVRLGSLLSGGCILCTDVVSPDVVAAVADILRRCRVYILVCGFAFLSISSVAERSVADVEEGIVQFL